MRNTTDWYCVQYRNYVAYVSHLSWIFKINSIIKLNSACSRVNSSKLHFQTFEHKAQRLLDDVIIDNILRRLISHQGYICFKIHTSCMDNL